jgi:preprotein translocase subunit SecG
MKTIIFSLIVLFVVGSLVLAFIYRLQAPDDPDA